MLLSCTAGSRSLTPANVIRVVKTTLPELPIIALTPTEREFPWADHVVHSHDPQELLEVVHRLFGDPRKHPPPSAELKRQSKLLGRLHSFGASMSLAHVVVVLVWAIGIAAFLGACSRYFAGTLWRKRKEVRAQNWPVSYGRITKAAVFHGKARNHVDAVLLLSRCRRTVSYSS